MRILHSRKILLASLLIATTILGLSAAPMTASAACGGGTSSSKDIALSGVGETGDQCNDNGVFNVINTVVNILSIVVGIAAIIIIIASGFKYITSGGDSSRVSSAKTTLIYALVGLAIAAIAQVLVHFVLFQSNNATLPACPSDHSVQPPNCHN